MDMPVSPTNGIDSETPEEPEETDLSNGYVVCFYVWPDGTYSIGEPEGIDEEERAENEANEGEQQTDLTSAMKRLLNVVKANPVGTSDEDQFTAGYNAGPAGQR